MDKQLKLRIAKKYIDQGESSRAISILQEFIEDGDDDVFFLMGKAYQNGDDLLKAFEWYEKCSDDYEQAKKWVANLKAYLGYGMSLY